MPHGRSACNRAVFLLTVFLFTGLFLFHAGKATAERAVELPVLAAINANNRGVFEILLIWWDRKAEPDPVALQWYHAGVKLGDTHLGAMTRAFRYAVERTPAIHHRGTVSVRGVAYMPTSSD
ncbi:MAG: hypothetical protein HY205_03965, partial [Nitrospirae bacterium]|nr:hypothetical protein [Nitrospirota bacterium]